METNISLHIINYIGLLTLIEFGLLNWQYFPSESFIFQIGVWDTHTHVWAGHEESEKGEEDPGKSKSMIVAAAAACCSWRDYDYDYRASKQLGNLSLTHAMECKMQMQYCKEEWTTQTHYLSNSNWFAGNMLYGQSRSKAYKRTLLVRAIMGPPHSPNPLLSWGNQIQYFLPQFHYAPLQSYSCIIVLYTNQWNFIMKKAFIVSVQFFF